MRSIAKERRDGRAIRHRRIRVSIRGTGERPRLAVYRSLRHLYAQIIDDTKGVTVAAASSLEKDVKGTLKTGADKDAAAAIGKLIAERAIKAGVKDVVFDRGGYLYHGHVKELAEGAREGGLEF